MNQIVLLILQFISGLAAGGAWLYLVYIGKADAGTLVGTLQTLLGALIMHIAHTAANQASPATAVEPPLAASAVFPPGTQKGFTLTSFLVTLIPVVFILLVLGGCATGYRTAFTAVDANAKAADDNLVMTYKAAICGLPLSAILRNADIIPGIKALCLPGGNASDPNGILPTPFTANSPVQVQIVPNNPQGK
jgi:hypothetical protein